MDPKQFLEFVIRPTIEPIGLGGAAAERLLLGTALAETNLTSLHQLNGPALGVYQIEPATHMDVWGNFIRFHPDLQEQVLARLSLDPSGLEQLITNLSYQTIIARVIYRRVPTPLPAPDDALSLYQYYKAHWNTSLGAANDSDIAFFKQAVSIA